MAIREQGKGLIPEEPRRAGEDAGPRNLVRLLGAQPRNLR